ncbi:MAG TPA: DUF1501 domain-containing protein [Planctomycetaceae bacterium]|nr:DUF1501 domain-containing protein [Planctomycetaceae bacterium]
MLRIGQLLTGDCQRLTRRELIRAGALSAVGVSLADALRAQARSPEAAPAKSVILLWLWGGPSHLDTFDLKPNAPVQYRGPYSPIPTTVPGVEICELLPQLSKRAHTYSLLRSLRGTSNDHGIAGTIGLTGSSNGAASLSGQVLPGAVEPTHGSIVSKILGASTGMPRFMTLGGHLHQGKRAITGEGGAALGPMHDPFRLDYHPDTGLELPHLTLADGLTPSGIDARGKLQLRLDQLARGVDRSPNMARLDEYYQQAFSLLTDPAARNVFDLDREPEPLRRRYGKYRFGQCCLLARRLVEAGAKFVQVNWSSHVEPVEDSGDGGWDMHDRYFQQYQDRHAWMLDRALSALLDDLRERGLLSETVVVAVGEFGRTPKINNKAGRDHWEHVYSGLVAGGGLQAGKVIGASDRLGEYPATAAFTSADLFATVLGQLGITTTSLTTNNLLPQGNRIEDLIG